MSGTINPKLGTHMACEIQ